MVEEEKGAVVEKINVSEIIAEPKEEITYEFKDKMLGLDFIAAAEGKTKDKLQMMVRLAANMSTKPKLSYKKIVMLPIKEFNKIIGSFMKKYKDDLSNDSFLE